MIRKHDKDTIHSYLEDSSNLKGGFAEEVIIPDNPDEVRDILRDSYSSGKPVLVSGGGTATTGSRVPFGGTVLSMEHLNRKIALDEKDMVCQVEAGVLVDSLKNLAENHNLFYTSHPTEKTAFVGGTISTNASGARSFKYGPTRDYVKSLSMILADGAPLTIRRGENKLTKRNSAIKLSDGRKIDIPLPSYKIPSVKSAAGYFAYDGMDAIDLFIGQEGTLSVIVEAEIALARRPKKIISAFVFFTSEDKAWDFANIARIASRDPLRSADAIEALSIEYFDSSSLDILKFKNSNVPKDSRAAIFFEQESSDDREERLLKGEDPAPARTTRSTPPSRTTQ